MSNENNAKANVSQTLLGANDKGRVTYQVNGEEINLSFQIVRNFLTRGDGTVTDAEVIMFISLCKANGLNPFVGDCWLVKYASRDGRPAQPAQMITSRDAFMKRGEASGDVYVGFRSGVIIIRDGKPVEIEGSFFLPTDQLVGGWAEVHRKDRRFPILSKVRLVEYNTGKSTWSTKPGTMIIKVAEAQAFRKAFPIQMSGLYTPEELPDEQLQQISSVAPNVAIPEFKEEETVERPSPEQAADPETEFTPDPVPVDARTNDVNGDKEQFLRELHGDDDESLFKL